MTRIVGRGLARPSFWPAVVACAFADAVQLPVDLGDRNPPSPNHHPADPLNVGEILQRVPIEQDQVGAGGYDGGSAWTIPVFANLLSASPQTLVGRQTRVSHHPKL